MIETHPLFNQRYRIHKKLGQHAGQQTWQAEDITKTPTEPVIIKLLAFDPHSQWNSLKLFEREATVLKHLTHPCIPQYRDYFSIKDGFLWFGLVHDYIPGHSLKELLNQGHHFSELEVRNIATSLLDILIYLHELSPTVLHRDIKPSNIILGQENTINLIDFGSVQARAAVEGATFTIVGTYGYTPMEQFGGRAVAASDLYALGATLIHLLTGTAPADLPQRDTRIQFQPYVSISSELSEWIQVLTHPSPEQRFLTARQALAALTHGESIPSQLAITQPQNSRIQLSKSHSQLGIQMPSRGLRCNDSFILLWALLLYGITIPFSIVAFPFVILYWIVGATILGALLVPALSHIELFIDRNNFVLKWKFFRLRYRFIEGHTATLHKIIESKEPLTRLNGSPMTIIELQTERKTYHLSGIISPLSTLERQWIVKEINDWLIHHQP
ncbi:MAG: serine/threonine-protein kinase [Cyanobacteria bacterium J06634_6]